MKSTLPPFLQPKLVEAQMKATKAKKEKKLSKEEFNFKRLLGDGLSVFRASLHVLMSRDKIPQHWEVKPEEKLCVDFADYLRQACLDGHYNGIWAHIPNEGKRHPLTALVLRAMGVIKGNTDYYFIWSGGGGVLEAKSAAGQIQFTQKLFANWCVGCGVPHAYFRTVEEGQQKLREWGALA